MPLERIQAIKLWVGSSKSSILVPAGTTVPIDAAVAEDGKTAVGLVTPDTANIDVVPVVLSIMARENLPL